jgi:hypothetical protein
MCARGGKHAHRMNAQLADVGSRRTESGWICSASARPRRSWTMTPVQEMSVPTTRPAAAAAAAMPTVCVPGWLAGACR